MSEPATILDPKASPTYRAAKAAVIILSALILIALGALVAGIVLKMAGKGAAVPAAARSAAFEFALPPGASILSAEVSGDRLVLRVKGPAGEEIDIVDTVTGRLVTRIKTAK